MNALRVLSTVMTDSRDEDEILDLALAALPSLSRGCRGEAVWLDGRWRSVQGVRGRVGPQAQFEAQVRLLGSAGGPIRSPDSGWGWAFPLLSPGGGAGYLVASAPEPPPDHEKSLIQGLVQQTSVALANARLLASERGMRARLSDEQETLRRVATLVARSAPSEEVFAVVAAEAGRLLDADFAVMSRFEPTGTAIVVGAWNRPGLPHPLPRGTRVQYPDRSVHTLVFDTNRPARIEDYGEDGGAAAALARHVEVRSTIGVPITLGDRLWGMIGVASRRVEPLASDSEVWLAGFTELIATAISNTEAQAQLRGIAEEQAALRRVATVVAQSESAEEVFGAVATEVGQLLGVDFTVLSRYEPDGGVIVVGPWAKHDPGRPLPVGIRLEPGGRNMHTLVFQTGSSARIDSYGDATGHAANVARDWGFRSAVGVPIYVEHRLWGVISVGTGDAEPLPADTEARLAEFTELVATALANAQAQTELTASRARIVAAADDTRRRIVRDLHDGAQQRLVSLALQLRATQATVPPEAEGLVTQLDSVADRLIDVMEELRQIALGIHPAILAEGGLRPALKALARRSPVPVRVDVSVEERLPEPVELAAYYVVAEALTNVAKHAHAGAADVEVATEDAVLFVRVTDDGRGGADVSRGTGLVGIADRVGTLGGRVSLRSAFGEGTTLEIELPTFEDVEGAPAPLE
jgi:signal transduction histidine kinase